MAKRVVCAKCQNQWVITHHGASGESSTFRVCHACGSQHEWTPIELSGPRKITIGEVAEEMVSRDNDKFLKKQAAEAAARNEAAAARAAEAAGEAGKRDKWEAVKV